ncbi:MAG TPA: PHB depolymerase family esterase, partial [Rubellimicrobium sp.]|nr:PHB depolymerase family esterase [Rubellimicrobium sp.]
PQLSQADMMEATRLTREGRLEEAMALLQGTRGSTSSRPATQSDPSEASDAPMRGTPPLIDMLPPSAASGGAWSSPFPKAAAAPGGAGAPSPEMPAALRGLMERMGGLAVPEGAGAGLGETLKARLGGAFGSVATRTPAIVPDGALFEERSFANAAGTRPYKLYVPSMHKGEPLPLVVMLHGCTQSPDDFAMGTRMNELAEELGFLVVYPGQTQAANMQKCWNWFNAADQQRDQGEPTLIAGITRAVMQDVPVLEGRVYVAGLSAGGAAAAIMGATYPDLYAAVGVHSGLACGAARDMVSAFGAMKQGSGPGGAQSGSGRPVPTIVFHGDRDTTVHPVNGDEVLAQAKAGAAHLTQVDRGTSPGGMGFTRTVHRDDAGQAVLEQWVLHGAGHAWSGGSASGSYTDPKGPDASREMMRFFLEHDRSATGRI